MTALDEAHRRIGVLAVRSVRADLARYRNRWDGCEKTEASGSTVSGLIPCRDRGGNRGDWCDNCRERGPLGEAARKARRQLREAVKRLQD